MTHPLLVVLETNLAAASNYNKSVGVLLVQENPKTSLNQLALNKSISKRYVQVILEKAKYCAYKKQNVQELLEGDFDRRVEFWERMIEMSTQDPIL